nr:fimbrillin family protein [Bacteroides sp. 14(A)]
MACSDDYGTQLPDSGDGRISFSVSNAGGTDAETRSASPVYDPLVLLGGNGGDTLYLHTLVIDSIPSRTPDDAGPQTRGVPVTTTTLSAFGVTAMLDDHTAPYMNNVPITVSNQIGSPANPYFWPEGTLRFYAYSPQGPLYTNADEKPEFSDGTILFQYTTPKSSDGTTDAEQQPDVLFAYAAASLANQPDGQVPLTFHHALSAIKFVAGDIAGGTIKQISIKNVYGEGSATYDASQEENPRFEWMFDEEAKPDQSYTQTFNVKVDDALTGTQKITDKDPVTTFMMIPQELTDDALIEVVIDIDEDGEKTLTGKIKSNGLAAWEAGKQYTYTISTNSINWTYVLEVTKNVTIPFGSTTGEYTVQSYRYRTNNPSNIEAVGWSATSNADFITDYIDKDNGVIEKGDGVDSKENKETYSITVTRPETKTDYGGDETLRNNPSKGSDTTPFDLSTNGRSEARTTANCYVVSAPGTYSLPLVYGNAIKDGATYALSYQEPSNGQSSSTAFKNYKGIDITSPEISDVADCCLVWCDAFYVIRDVKLSDDKQSLVFTVAEENLQQCNAIVAARNKNSTIMWSWHIWITEHDISDAVEVQDWETNGTSTTYYDMMKWPLGWVDGKTVTYEKRSTDITFTQKESGKTATLALKKDPIVALKNRDKSGPDDYRPLEIGQDSYGYVIANERVSLAKGIQNPNTLYGNYDISGATTWLTISYKNLWDNSGNSTNISQTISIKTVYDPSPRGFKVPPARAFSQFVKGHNTSPSGNNAVGELNGSYKSDSVYIYNVYYDEAKSNTIRLIATGQRSDRASLGGVGSLWAMDGVYYQTCNALNNKDESYCLVLRNMELSLDAGKVYTYGFSGSQTMARPVRSIKE